MTEPTITCPECSAEIVLTEALAAPMISASKKELEVEMERNNKVLEERWEHVRQTQRDLVESEKALDDKVATQVEAVRMQIEVEAEKKAQATAKDELEQAAEQLKNTQMRLDEKDEKLVEAQKAQADALRERRELDEEKREMDLTVEKKIREGLDNARSQALKDAEDRMTLKVREKEETIAGMQRQIEVLRQKAEQGSQQTQGEVQELQLEEVLRAAFLDDLITPVPKGAHGGDIVQSVVSLTGRDCGAILWESKRTKTWSGAWLPKLRDDQRVAKADIAVIVSQVLPKGLETFGLIDGVWVCSPTMASALAAVLRQGMLEVTKSKLVTEGMKTKAEEIYQYLTGSQFKRRVEAIVEAFSTMQLDLDKERKAITKQWNKREVQIERVMQSTVGMCGDLEGIAGQSIQEAEQLAMKALSK